MAQWIVFIFLILSFILLPIPGIYAETPAFPAQDQRPTWLCERKYERTSGLLPTPSFLPFLGLSVACVTVKSAGGRKLAQLMSDHILRNEDRDKFLAVMHRKSEAHHIGNNRRPARPRLDDLTRTGLTGLTDFL